MKKTVPNSYFAHVAELLQAGKHVRIQVLGDSMYPLIRGGRDEIELIPREELGELPLYSALFYQWEGHYMIHRYVGKEGDELIINGDGNAYRYERVKEAKVVGVLKTIYRGNRVIDCLGSRWMNQGKWWYRVKPIRRYLLFIFKKVGLFR